MADTYILLNLLLFQQKQWCSYCCFPIQLLAWTLPYLFFTLNSKKEAFFSLSFFLSLLPWLDGPRALSHATGAPLRS
ncbi:Ubiquitin-conjugating enzyme E2 2 [Zea mays]|uniref:Ubiquitin-conjugating enzyme E2 2 n=1 Tax=Zea mays TaxID=4577 RepID=A0A1D6LKH9_MAIZE|nr:Ubiquitin-conjugating enzyme E2 2 [Zea mays]AQK80215.1 Ubiquitin-conjugating enzyme E2 2 [Zea mays]